MGRIIRYSGSEPRNRFVKGVSKWGQSQILPPYGQGAVHWARRYKTGYAWNCCLNPESAVIYAGECVKGFTTLFKKVEAVHATPQDLSTVLRWARGMCILAGPATLD
ncbi:hypothetical protein PN483_11270 [Nodularia spumigena CS-591/04]|nr:hypothetical protein [Nodularia spumigena]MDB9331067.1 hypothetical protein [Nodularia spumigena CS-591/04]